MNTLALIKTGINGKCLGIADKVASVGMPKWELADWQVERTRSVVKGTSTDIILGATARGIMEGRKSDYGIGIGSEDQGWAITPEEAQAIIEESVAAKVIIAAREAAREARELAEDDGKDWREGECVECGRRPIYGDNYCRECGGKG